MIETKTVFVLGAGASHPYGLPLGNELYKCVIQDFTQKDQATLVDLDASITLANTTSFNQKHIDHFISALKFSGLTSVDAFLEKRQEFIDLGKAIMAIELLKREKHEMLWAVPEANWLQYIYARLITKQLKDFGRNAVSFITYNYDRTLEHFIHTSLMNTYGQSSAACAEAFSNIGVIHLHGRLGYLPWQRSQNPITFGAQEITPQVIDMCQSEIRIVHESVDDRNVEFNAARRILWEAKRIYFLGFGYAPQNIERLNFGEMTPMIAEGTALGITQREQSVIIKQLSGKVALQELDCLAFLRQRVVWD